MVQGILRILALGSVALAALAGSASAAVRYASPVGGGSAPCETEATPCDVDAAITVAGPGDEVVLAPGDYLRGARIEVPNGVRLRGASRSERSHVIVTGDLGIWLKGPAASVSDLGVTERESPGAPALAVANGTAERVRAQSEDEIACTIGGGELADSVCFVLHPALGAQGLVDGFPGSHTSRVVNSTIYTTGGAFPAIGVSLTVGSSDTSELQLVNTIVQGEDEDIRIRSNSATATAIVSSRNSDHGAPTPFGGGGVEAYEDLEGNISAPPLFVNVAAADFAEAAGSPTIDAGDPAAAGIGALDLSGAERVQNGVPDIGAYEFTPSSGVGGGDESVVSSPPASSSPSSTSPTPPPPAAGQRCKSKRATIVARSKVTVGTKRRDVIVGRSGKDVIHGRGGNDLICGRGGGDVLHGDAGNDVLLGGAGADLLFGGSGVDQLRGGSGRDLCNGQKGRDRRRAPGCERRRRLP